MNCSALVPSRRVWRVFSCCGFWRLVLVGCLRCSKICLKTTLTFLTRDDWGVSWYILICFDSAQMDLQICDLEALVDDAENWLRQNNLVFYRLPDPTTSATFVRCEESTIPHCSGHLNLTLNLKETERAHRLGHHKATLRRSIIVKFTSTKTKEFILSSGYRFY